jgi:hypothetical protein
MQNQDGSEPLDNHGPEQFALLVAEGEEPEEAFRLAGVTDDSDADTSGSRGAKLANTAAVKRRAAWLRTQANRWLKEKAARTVLTIIEKRQFLAGVVRARAGTIEPTSDLLQFVKGSELKLPCKIAAIKLDNDLAEEGAEARGQTALAKLAAKLRV